VRHGVGDEAQELAKRLSEVVRVPVDEQGREIEAP
jgi:hypothetical protein